jgi:peptide deformylase
LWELPLATRPIITWENPRLRMHSVKVKRIDANIRTLIDDMIDTMRANNGIGLAAPQVGVLLRVVVCEYTDEETEEVHQTILVNPEITAKEGEYDAEEGCLSIPGYYGVVPRAVSVSVKGKDRQGKDVKIKTDGTLAHILQHEIDHLDGILYIDYLESLDQLQKVDPDRPRRRRRRRADGTMEPFEDAEETEPVQEAEEQQQQTFVSLCCGQGVCGEAAE